MIVPNEILHAARVALGISRPELAKITGLGERTILRLESNERVTVRTLQLVQVALEGRGAEFMASAGDKGPGMRIPLSLLSRDDLRF